MPTSSARLEARANAYMEAATAMEILSSRSDYVLESDEYDRLAKKLWLEYDRIIKLAETQEKKEQEREQERQAQRSNP